MENRIFCLWVRRNQLTDWVGSVGILYYQNNKLLLIFYMIIMWMIWTFNSRVLRHFPRKMHQKLPTRNAFPSSRLYMCRHCFILKKKHERQNRVKQKTKIHGKKTKTNTPPAWHTFAKNLTIGMHPQKRVNMKPSQILFINGKAAADAENKFEKKQIKRQGKAQQRGVYMHRGKHKV